jgi:hypothetical protein
LGVVFALDYLCQANKLTARVKMNTYLVQVGNGDKLHLGHEYIRTNKPSLMIIKCGSRRMGTAKRIISVADLTTYKSNARSCEKCADKVGA